MDEPASDPRSEKLLAHGRFLRGLARSLVAESDRAEDLVQDTWTVALERPPRHDRALGSWLASILRRLAVTRGRREGERASREAEAARPEVNDAVPGPVEVAAELELQRRVFECVERLREPYKSTIFLRYYRGLEPQVIAAQEGVPVKTVKTRLLRGLDLLRADLDRLHGGRREAWVALLLPMARATPVPLGNGAPPSASSPLAPAAVLAAGALAVAAGWTLFSLWTGGPEIQRDDLAPTPAAPPSAAESTARTLPDDGPPAARARTALDRPHASWPARASARLKGRVLDAAGDPLLGAEVAAHSLWSSAQGRDHHEPPYVEARGGEARSEAAPEGASTRTDAAGAFELVLPDAGFLRLDVEADGFAPLGRKLVLFPEQELDLDAIVLMRGVRLAGRVRDADGRPLAGAEVWQERLDEGLTLGSGSPRLELVARTDERGAFAVNRQAVGPWSLAIREDEHPVAWAAGETSCAGERTDDVEIVLEEGVSVAGRVRGEIDPGSRAFVLALLLRRAEPGERIPTAAEFGARRIPVGEDGAFTVKGLDPETEVELSLQIEDASGNLRLASAPRRARAGETSVELEPSRGGTISFQVVDARSAAPLAGVEARIEIGGTGPWKARELVARRSDEQGRVRLESPGPDLGSGARVVVRADGYRSRLLEDPSLSPLAERDLGRIELEPAPRVQIEVRDAASGDAVPGAVVTWAADRPDLRGHGEEELGWSTAHTDETGGCILAGEPLREGTLVVRSAGYALQTQPFAFPDAAPANPSDTESAPVEVVRLLHGGRVEIEARDAEGAPVAGGLVVHLPQGDSEPHRFGPDASTIRPTDEAGRVLWEHLAPGRHAFRLARAPFGFEGRPIQDRGGWTEVEVAEDGLARVTLRAEPTASLAVRVRLGGTALAGAQVIVRSPKGSNEPGGLFALSTVTDGEGRIALADLAPGEQSLEIRHEALSLPSRRSVLLAAGANELALELDDGRVAGRVTDGEGRALSGARVRAFRGETGAPEDFGLSFGGRRGPSGSSAEVRTDEAGRFALEGLDLATPLVLEVSAEGRATTRTEALSPRLETGVETGDLELVLGPEARLEVVLEASDAARAVSTLVARPLSPGSRPSRALFLRANAGRTLDGLSPGTWRIELYESSRPGKTPPAPIASRDVELVAGETTTLRLSLP